MRALLTGWYILAPSTHPPIPRRPSAAKNDREEQAAVRVEPLSAFIGGGAMEDVRRVVVATDPGLTVYPPSDVVARALTRVGETGYWLPTNNCEHCTFFVSYMVGAVLGAGGGSRRALLRTYPESCRRERCRRHALDRGD